ncbi:MAG: hypothetical protein BAJATHORv1_10463 [Candidatus Thorarchaeota archaeon]|nr:MAG: hypothetical protein BAJATHORv1_10463 [Candidatus Thorarchaeota archaeon]
MVTMVKDVGPKEIEDIIKDTRLVFVDCWAPWCGPCRALAPVLEELETEYEDNPDVKILKLNTEDHRSYAVEKRITAIPCVLVFLDGKPASFVDPSSGKEEKTDRLIGLAGPERYKTVIENLL